MNIRPKSCLALSSDRKVNSKRENINIKFEKFQLKKIKRGVIKKLLLNEYKKIVKKNIFDKNINIHSIKKDSYYNMTPFQVYQKIKKVKFHKISNKIKNKRNKKSLDKICIFSKNKTLLYSANHSNQKNKKIKIIKNNTDFFEKNNNYNNNNIFKSIKLLKLKNYNNKLIPRLKTKIFVPVNEYNDNLTDLTRMLKIESYNFKKNNDIYKNKIKYNEINNNFNNYNKNKIACKSKIILNCSLKNYKAYKFRTINKSVNQIIDII